MFDAADLFDHFDALAGGPELLIITGFYGLFQFFHAFELYEHFEVFAGTAVVVQEFFEPVLFIADFLGGGGIDDIAGGTGEAFGEDDVFHTVLYDCIFVFVADGSFEAGNEAGTDGYAVGAEQEGAGDLATVCDTAGGYDDFVGEVGLEGGEEYVHGVWAGVATGTGGNGDEAVAAGFSGFFGVGDVGHIAEDFGAVAVGGGDNFFWVTEGGDIEGYFGVGADLEVFFVEGVCLLDDEVYAIGALWGMGTVLVQVVEYGLEFALAAVVEGGEGAGYAGVHGGFDHDFIAYKEHGGHDHRIPDGQG